MLKIIKQLMIYFLAVTICDASIGDMPMKLLQSRATFYKVTVTAYTNHSSCGEGNPNITASSVPIKPHLYKRLIALSGDLAKKYDYGDQFKLWVKNKLYSVTFLDRMSKRHRKHVDLLLPSLKKCRQFGRKMGVLVPMEQS